MEMEGAEAWAGDTSIRSIVRGIIWKFSAYSCQPQLTRFRLRMLLPKMAEKVMENVVGCWTEIAGAEENCFELEN